MHNEIWSNEYISGVTEDSFALLLVAVSDGGLIGTASLTPISSYKRMKHRCDLSIALDQKFIGVGIGKALFTVLLGAAKSMGYEQAELDVVSSNYGAIALYKKLGFVVCGNVSHAMKCADGTYADMVKMIKRL